MAAMKSKQSFGSIVELVLSGRCAVETMEGVEPWPTGVNVGDSVVSVLMHRDCPGAVALFGEIEGVTVLTGAYSSRLRDFLSREHSRLFRFDCSHGPEGSVRYLFKVCASMTETAKEHTNLRCVCGVDGAELLAALKVVEFGIGSLH